MGVAASALGLLPAVAVGWLLARVPFPGKSVFTALVMAPLVLPPVVTGLLMLQTFGRTTTIGEVFTQMGLPLSFSLFGAIMAALVVGFPLYVITIRSAFEAVDPRYEAVSASLGVPPLATWRRISLPLAFPGLAAGVVLAFARALGEFGATAILAGNIEGKTRTIALAVYTLLDAPNGESQVRVLLWASIAISFASLVGFEWLSRWQRRKLDLDHG